MHGHAIQCIFNLGTFQRTQGANMNKILPVMILSAFLFGCSDDSSSTSSDDNAKEISAQGNDYSSGETTDNFTKEDISKTEFGFTLAENFEMEDGYIHLMSDKDGKSTSVRNWVLSHNYEHLEGCGFTALVKVGKNMNFAGIQLFKRNSYDDYRFEVFGDGKFEVRDPKKSVLKLSADSSYIETDKFNRIKVETTDKGNVQVFVNAHHVLTIDQKDLAFDLTNTDKVAVMYNIIKHPAEAWIKMEELEIEK